MFEAILGGFIAVGLSVFANLITPFFQRLIGQKPPELPEQHPKPENVEESESLEEWRAQNREKLESALGKAYLYGFSYFTMYMAFYVPVLLNGGLLNISINLLDTKIAIDYIVTDDNLPTICAVFGVLAYVPFWKLSEIIAGIVASVAWRFTQVNDVKFLAFTVLAMVFWAFFVAGNVSYLLNVDAGWVDSVKSSLLLWILLFAAAFTNKK